MSDDYVVPTRPRFEGLRYHFSDNLPSQESALLAWVEHLLYQSDVPLTEGQLLEQFAAGDLLPYPITVERQEMRELLRTGTECEHLSVDKMGYALSEERRFQLERAAEDAARAEEQAREAWRTELSAVYPQLTTPLFDELWEGLWKVSALMIRRYVANTSAERSDLPSDLALALYPEGHPLHAIASVEYPRYLLSDEPSKQAIARRQMCHVLYVFRTSVSEDAQHELRLTLAGRALYLDTNVLLAALRLTGDESYEEGVRGILRLAKQSGMKLLYTSRTGEEFAAAMLHFKNRFASIRNPDVDPQYGIRRQRPSIERAFYLQRTKDYRSVEEFYERYHDLDAVADADDLGIKKEYLVTAEQLREVDSSEMKERALAALRSETRRNMDENVLEHDAFHLALVDYLRGNSARFKNLSSWFVTLDSSLPRVDRRLGVDMPIVMTPDGWILSFRQFLSRVDDFESFFAKVVTRSLFPNFYLDQADVLRFQRVLQADTTDSAREVVGRILRTRTANDISEAFGDGDEESSIAAALHDLAAQANQVEGTLAEYSHAQLDAQLREVRKSAAQYQSLAMKAKKEAEEGSEKFRRQLDELNASMTTWKSNRDTWKNQLDNAEVQKQAIERRRDRMSWALTAFLVSAFGVGLYFVWGRLPLEKAAQVSGVVSVFGGVGLSWFCRSAARAIASRVVQADLDSALTSLATCQAGFDEAESELRRLIDKQSEIALGQ